MPGRRRTFSGLTLRERLEQHKRDATCASCHLRIDPLGFPLEGFDAVGRERQTYADGKPVDVTGELQGQDDDRRGRRAAERTCRARTARS